MTWLGWTVIIIEAVAALTKIGDNKVNASIRVLTVVLAAALIVGILLVGTGHL